MPQLQSCDFAIELVPQLSFLFPPSSFLVILCQHVFCLVEIAQRLGTVAAVGIDSAGNDIAAQQFSSFHFSSFLIILYQLAGSVDITIRLHLLAHLGYEQQVIHSEIFRLAGDLGADGCNLPSGQLSVLAMVYLLEFMIIVVMPRLVTTHH